MVRMKPTKELVRHCFWAHKLTNYSLNEDPKEARVQMTNFCLRSQKASCVRPNLEAQTWINANSEQPISLYKGPNYTITQTFLLYLLILFII